MNNQQALRRALKSFYGAKFLPGSRVDFLLQEKTRLAQSARPWLTKPPAQIVALITAIVVFVLVADHEHHQQAIERAVCTEVAMSQTNHSPLEIISSRYSEVQAALRQLDFSITPAKSTILEAYRLMGGSYCSIQGVPAALLRVQNIRSCKECTLYAMKAAGKLHDITPTVESVDGVRVEVWRQDDVVFALAEMKN
jgi:anti-sigma factor RsiW